MSWFTRGEGHSEECLQSLEPHYPWLLIPALALWGAGAVSLCLISLGMVLVYPRARYRICDLPRVLSSSWVLWAHRTKHTASLVNRVECWVKTPGRMVWCFALGRGSHWGRRKVSVQPHQAWSSLPKGSQLNENMVASAHRPMKSLIWEGETERGRGGGGEGKGRGRGHREGIRHFGFAGPSF